MRLESFQTRFAALLTISGYAFSISFANTGTITVGPDNIKLYYTDSGPPENDGPYTTAFLVHGLTFNGGIFERVQALAPSSNIRLVSVNRRDYRESTPYSATDLATISNGTDSQRTAFLTTIGLELATFIDRFMEQKGIQLPDKKGETGSISVISWSAGAMATLSAIANVKNLPADVQKRLAVRLHSLIIHEPNVESLGIPPFVNNYIPLFDTSVPANTTGNLTAQYLTNYFQHGDLSTRNPFVLSWIVPSVMHAPSIFDLSAEQYNAIVQIEQGTNDFAIMFHFPTQLNSNYQNALFDHGTRAFLPNMNIFSFSGANTAALGLYSRFVMQADNDAKGGTPIHFAPLLQGANHLVHWDSPSMALKEYLTLVHT